MLECCIIFSHYANDERTVTHLRLLRQLNPYPVVAIHRGPGRPVRESIDVDRLGATSLTEDPWGGVDATLLGWFKHRGLEALRYVHFDWDTLATMPVREYYSEVWDCDVAAANVLLPGRDAWDWFRQVVTLPPPLRSHGAGLMPFNWLFFSHRALAALCGAELPANIFCELRIATLLRSMGFSLTQMPDHRRATNSWHPSLRFFDPRIPGIYHPVKTERAPLEPELDLPALAAIGSGSPVDILATIDPDRDRLQGDWQLDDASLVSPGSERGRVRLPVVVAGDYRLEVIARRESGNDCLAFTLPIAGAQVTLLIDGYQGKLSGLQRVDGENIDTNETKHEGAVFTDATWRSIVIGVRRNRMQATCDGKRIVDWTGDVSRLQPADESIYSDRLYLGTWFSRYRLLKIELTRFSAREP